MDCKYFGICGSCVNYENGYEEELNNKISVNKTNFEPIYGGDIEIFKSNSIHFRSRAEFKVWHVEDDISYALTSKEKKTFCIDECKIVSKPIYDLMPKIKDYIEKIEILSRKLFSIEFLSSQKDEVLVTLIYHKKLDQEWKDEALKLQENLNISIIGRSRKQKEVLKSDYITETLHIYQRDFFYTQYESSFTQPNAKVNEKMISWVIEKIIIEQIDNNSDLLELYCGNGNFTIPLSLHFKSVLATEISKASIKSAKQNLELNNITNIKFARLSDDEFTEAFEKNREFTRLKQDNINLDDYNFSTIFVDPPRSGLSENSTKLAQKFDNILYISCNPQTLKRDLEELTKTHQIINFAFFDQFAYTNHIESGVILRGKWC
jgi:tRNA (uracil-5-)-methyltransferase